MRNKNPGLTHFNITGLSGFTGLLLQSLCFLIEKMEIRCVSPEIKIPSDCDLLRIWVE
jgi:hypothetical protein